MGQLRPHPNTSELIACSAEPKTLRFVVLFEVPEGLQQFADITVVLNHAVGIFVVGHAALPPHRGANMREEMHAGGVHPDKEWLIGLDLPLHEVDRCRGGFVIDRLHPLLGQRAGILDALLAYLAEAWVDGGIIDIAGFALDHAARAELLLEAHVFRIVGVFRILLGIEVVEVAEETHRNRAR